MTHLEEFPKFLNSSPSWYNSSPETLVVSLLNCLARSRLTYGCHESRSTTAELAILSTTYKRFLRSMIINGYKRVNPPNPSAEKSGTVDWSYAVRYRDLFSITQTDSIESLYAEHQLKPVYKGHPREASKVAFIERWPLHKGSESGRAVAFMETLY
ncbi:hypothetical protein GQR58_026202 [Nymphon striatum]|nr:hypothetical protein GQR58_026202 [Nymphon striatum]